MKKILIIIPIVIVILFVVLFFLPFIFKDTLLEKTKEILNDNVTAKVDFDNDLKISLFRDFPNLSVQLNELNIHEIEGFSNDTIFYAKTIYFITDLISVIKGENIQVKSVSIIQPIVNILINENGLENWTQAIKHDSDEDKDSEDSNDLTISIQEFIVENGSLVYEDQKEAYLMEAEGVNYTMEGDFTQSVFDMNNLLEVDDLDFSMGKVKYIHNAKAIWNAELGIDLDNDMYQFHDNLLKLNELKMSLAGEVKDVLKDTMQIDLKAELNQTSFKNLLSIVPGAYTKDYKNVKADGKANLVLWAMGAYDGEELIPKFALTSKISEAWVQYPGLPKKIESISIDLLFENKTGKKSDTQLVVNQFNCKLGKDKISGALLLKEALTKNSFLDLNLTFNLDLAEVKNYYPLEDNKLNGDIAGDIKAKGRMKELESGSYQKIESSGVFSANNVKIETLEFHLPIYIEKTSLTLSPQSAKLHFLKGSLGQTDFYAEGSLQNIVAYLFSNQTLVGNLNVKSNVLNISELNPESSSDESQKSTKTQINQVTADIFELPKAIDFKLKATANTIIYEDLTLKDMKSDLHLHDQKLEFKNTSFGLWEGRVDIAGIFEADGSKKPKVDYQFKVDKLSIAKTLKSFNWITNYIPYTKKIVGDFSTNFSFSSLLNEDYTPDLNSLDMLGFVDFEFVDISDFTTVTELKSKLNPKSSNENTVLENVLVNLKLKQGNLIVDPFNFSIGDIKINLGGKTSLDRKIDYGGIVELPSYLLEGSDQKLKSLTKGTPFAALDINTNDLLKLKIGIDGDLTQPKLNLGLKDVKKNVQKQLTESIKSTLKSEKEKVMEKVKEEINENIIKEIDTQKEKVKEEINEKIGKETSAILDSLGGGTKVKDRFKSLLGK